MTAMRAMRENSVNNPFDLKKTSVASQVGLRLILFLSRKKKTQISFRDTAQILPTCHWNLKAMDNEGSIVHRSRLFKILRITKGRPEECLKKFRDCLRTTSELLACFPEGKDFFSYIKVLICQSLFKFKGCCHDGLRMPPRAVYWLRHEGNLLTAGEVHPVPAGVLKTQSIGKAQSVVLYNTLTKEHCTC